MMWGSLPSVGDAMEKKPTKQAPSYEKQKLFDAYVSIVTFQRRVWEAALEVFLKPAGETPFQPRMTRIEVMEIVAPDLLGAVREACVITVQSGIACLLDPHVSMNDPSKPNLNNCA